MAIYSEKFSDKELEKSVMHSDKFSDKELGNDVKKLQNPATERREEDEKMRQIVKEHEEGMARLRQRIRKLEQEERRLKDVQEKEGRIDFFPTWKPAQGVKNDAEEEVQYMTIGEDGR